MGFQSHSFYLVLGSHFKMLLNVGDTTELNWDRAETNPSKQPNQPSVLGNWVKTEVPAMNMVTGKRSGMGRVSRDSSVISAWIESTKRIALRGPLSD